MNKKAEYGVLISIVVLVITVTLFILYYPKIQERIGDQADDYLDINKYLPNASFLSEEDVPDEVIDYAVQLAHQLFDTNYDNKNFQFKGQGELLYINKRAFDETYYIGFRKIDPSMPLRMYIQKTDKLGHVFYLHDLQNEPTGFIDNYDVCVLPQDKRALGGIFGLHRATGIPFKTTATKNKYNSYGGTLESLMENHVVNVARFETGDRVKIDYPFGGKNKDQVLASRAQDRILVLRDGNVVCFLPTGGGVSLHTGKYISDWRLKGDGFLSNDIADMLYNRGFVEVKG